MDEERSTSRPSTFSCRNIHRVLLLPCLRGTYLGLALTAGPLGRPPDILSWVPISAGLRCQPSATCLTISAPEDYVTKPPISAYSGTKLRKAVVLGEPLDYWDTLSQLLSAYGVGTGQDTDTNFTWFRVVAGYVPGLSPELRMGACEPNQQSDVFGLAGQDMISQRPRL